MPEDRPTLTVFRDAEIALRNEYRNARLDAKEFQRRISRCALASCRGMCCYGGVRVDNRTAEVLQELSGDRASDFRQMGLELPNPVVESTQWRGVSGTITVVKPFSFRTLVAEYPTHFDETACTFLMDDGRCGLQVLAEVDRKHPWYYKPFSCWLLPIKLWEGRIRLFDKESDPFQYAGYDGFISETFCGRTSECGRPAAQVLEPELSYLGQILDRDLVKEAAATTA